MHYYDPPSDAYMSWQGSEWASNRTVMIRRGTKLRPKILSARWLTAEALRESKAHTCRLSDDVRAWPDRVRSALAKGLPEECRRAVMHGPLGAVAVHVWDDEDGPAVIVVMERMR